LKPRRYTITRSIIVVTFVALMLIAVPTTDISSLNQDNLMESTNPLQEITEDEPHSIPKEDMVQAEVTWHWSGANTLASAPWGSADYPSRLSDDDSSLCRMSEEADGANWRFDLRFRTGAIYAHRYITHELRMDFTQIWSLAPEDLKFYVALGTASGAEGAYTYVGQLSGPGVHTFALDSAILYNPSITSTRFVYVRILGAIESSDPANGNVWDFDFLQIAYLHFAPQLKSASVDKLEDDVIYARLGVSGNNFATITVEGECWDGSEAWDLVTLRFEQGSNYWQAGWTWISGITFGGNADWVTYVDGSVSFTSTTIIMTWNLRFNWNHPIDTGMVLTLSTHATSPLGTNDPKVVDLPWRIETGLDMETTPYIDDSRVRTGETCSYAGDIQYHGSAGHWSPLASEIDIQVRRNSPQTSSWTYSAQPASDGTFTVEPNTATTSGMNTFELQVVADGTTTNLLTTTYSDTVIGDRVIVSSDSIGSENYISSYAGGVCNTGQTDTLFLELEWESSGATITSATSVSWASFEDTISLSYSSGRWEGETYARSTGGEVTYNGLTVIVDGIDFEIVTEPSYDVLWDEIVILTTVIDDGDDYVDIGNTVTIWVTASLSYMNHPLNPEMDSLYMNGVQMTADGAYFVYTVSHSYPGLWTFSVDDLDALESTFGITKLATGKPSVSCIWDTFLVDLSVDDSHVSIEDTARIWASVTRAYDGSVFSGSMGTVVLRHTISSDIAMTYSLTDEMWYANVTQSSANKWTYFIYSITDSAEQINTVGRGLNFDGIDDYVDCGSDVSLDFTSTLTLSTWFYGDGVDWGSGMYLLAKKDNNDAQFSLYIHSDSTLRFVYFNGTIREITLHSGVTRNAWHHVIVTISGNILNCWYDGVHVRENVILPATLTSFPSVPILLGAQKSGMTTSYHLEGFISEVRIYDIVLSEIQCKELYFGQDPADFGLKLFLGRASVDISTGTWNDLSGGTNDGIIVGVLVIEGNLPMIDEEVVNLIWDGVIITITDPISQTLSLGQNASGIIVSGIYAYDGLPYDGVFQLNNTVFSYGTPGQRGYNVESISGDSRGITAILLNDETYAKWVLQMTTLHLDPSRTSLPVSTIYDPQTFSVDIYLTDTASQMISGWINLTIDGDDYSIYCDGFVNSVFFFTPYTSGIYTLEATFDGDSEYDSAENNIILTASVRDVDFIDGTPTALTACISTPFGFLNVYDKDFQGEFQDVIYIHNFPINASFSIWWTISSEFDDPRTYSGSWNITSGEGIGNVILPWDLDGNGFLSSTDFMCYFIISLDGKGVYENITIEAPVNILQPLEVGLQIPSLTFSDQSEINVQVTPLYGSSFTEGLDLTITLYVSDDNSTWVSIGEILTTTSGWQSMNWTCTQANILFFKAETTITELYACSSGYTDAEAEKENTFLILESVGNFTYSDQGILVASLITDDGEPISDQTVYLEILTGTWISIGSGLTNESGHVSILWIPTLPADTYTIQIRTSFTGSGFYLTPEIAMGLLEVGKESTVVSIDSSTISQGYVLARVTDDDGNPVPNVIVNFYTGSDRDFRGTGTSDIDGNSRLDISLSNGEMLEVLVNENGFYHSSNQQITVALPLDLMPMGFAISAVCFIAIGIAASRKFTSRRNLSKPPSVTSEVSEALKEERELIPERQREEIERNLAEIEGDDTDAR